MEYGNKNGGGRYPDTLIAHAIRNHKTRVEVADGVTKQEVRNSIKWLMRKHPDIFWFAHQYEYDERAAVIYFQYMFSAERTKLIQQSIEDVIANDFHLDFVRGLSPEEQVAYIYKWLAAYCNYNPNSAYNQSIYSVFVRRNSVCTGYAKAAQYLFDLLGIESHLVFGQLNNDMEDGRHCWNIVKIDGRYYHFDSCFGDPVLDDVAKNAGGSVFKIADINWSFFCVSADEILKTRSIEDKETLPESHSSLSKDEIKKLACVEIKQRNSTEGCLLSDIGSSADIYLCPGDKNAVLKVFRSSDNSGCLNEYGYMQQLKGCVHVLQGNDAYSNPENNVLAVEQAVPFVDLLCSHYYKLSLKGLLRMGIDICRAWLECKQRGVLYRDLHICNIYLANDRIIKLGDFGSCTTDFGAVETVGNKWFMAPETYHAGIFTEASAVYSIAMIMYFVLNGLRPPFWVDERHASESLRRKMNGERLSLPSRCENMPLHLQTLLDDLLKKATEFSECNRISDVAYFAKELEDTCLKIKNDIIVHARGNELHFDFDANNITTCDQLSVFDPVEFDVFRTDYDFVMEVDRIEDFARTNGGNPDIVDMDLLDPYAPDSNLFSVGDPDIGFLGGVNDAPEANIDKMIIDGQEKVVVADVYDTFDIIAPDCAGTTDYNDDSFIASDARVSTEEMDECFKTLEESIAVPHVGTAQSNVDDTALDKVWSSAFAPAEVKRASHFLVQIYLHLEEEEQKVEALAAESDRNARRREHLPLQLKLKDGDKVDVEFNIYGSDRLMSERKSMIWHGSFTKCSFLYFVPADMNVGQLSCEALLSVNGIPVGEMQFLTDVVDFEPRRLHPEIVSHTFKRIFISYAHEDVRQVRHIALAYKAQGVDYFFDRDTLEPGDIYEEKIFSYIDNSDLFILCWSENAARSTYVTKEKSRALSRAYPQCRLGEAMLKIFPISIEPRTELPADMKEIYNFVEV